MASKLVASLKKNKALAELVASEVVKDEYVSTNCIPVNLLLSGKIKGGIKKGKISQICADSGWGKSMIGLNVLKAAQQQGFDCVVIDTEKAFNRVLAASLGINVDDIAIFESSLVPELKQIVANINNDLSRAEQRNVFILLDSWGPIVEQQVLDKAAVASTAVNMSGARFKNELAAVLSCYSNTVLVLNHVYATLQQYGDAFAIPGGKKLYFLSDAIMMASSAAKAKDKNGAIYGKIITASVKKGRAAKEFAKTKFLIEHSGGINPYYGLLDDAIAAGVVFKPKAGRYSRTDYDVDQTTGEVTRQWKEDELYCAKFWIPLYTDEKFNKYVEQKFAFADEELISATQDVLAMINCEAEIPDETKLVAESETEENMTLDVSNDEE